MSVMPGDQPTPLPDDIQAVGAVIFDEAGRLLLVRRAHEPARGTWAFPGGRVEPGEDARDAIIRVVMEETAVPVAIDRELSTAYRPAPGGGRFSIREFLMHTVGQVRLASGDDATDAGFFALDEIAQLQTTPGLLDYLRENCITE